MASSLVTSINSSLHGLELLVKFFERFEPSHIFGFKKLKVLLRNLKPFAVLCDRNLGQDNDDQTPRSPGTSVLAIIEDVVGRYGEEARAADVQMSDLDSIFHRFISEIPVPEKILVEFITGKSIQMSPQAASRLFTCDEVTDIADSIVENTAEFRSLGYYYFKYYYQEPVEALKVQIESLANATDSLGSKMTFLKNLIRFVLMVSSADDHDHQHLEDLLSHFEAVVVDAVRLFLMSSENLFDEEWYDDFRGRTSEVVRKIMPFDQEVNQTYIHSLTISRSLMLRRTMDIAPAEEGLDYCDYTVIVMKDFLDSLISIFGEKLQLNPPMRDQMQTLFEADAENC